MKSCRFFLVVGFSVVYLAASTRVVRYLGKEVRLFPSLLVLFPEDRNQPLLSLPVVPLVLLPPSFLPSILSIQVGSSMLEPLGDLPVIIAAGVFIISLLAYFFSPFFWLLDVSKKSVRPMYY